MPSDKKKFLDTDGLFDDGFKVIDDKEPTVKKPVVKEPIVKEPAPVKAKKFKAPPPKTVVRAEKQTVTKDVDTAKIIEAVKSLEPKIIVLDNKEILGAVKQSSATFNAQIEKLIHAISDKPKGLTLDISRDERGFTKSIKVTIEK